jgi:long-chain acyl-CoA synthetase
MGLNLGDCLRLSAIANPQAPCLVYDTLRLSYGEVDLAARRVAGLLVSAGVKPGDRVALMLPNLPQFPVIYFGILYAGATAVPLNPLIRPRELAHVLADAEVHTLFAFEEMADAAIAMHGSGALENLYLVEAGFAPKAHPVGRSFMEAFAGAEPQADMVQTRPEDLAVILYTAAQKGRPRGAMLSHFNLFNNALTISTRTLKYYPEDIFLCVLPLFHGFGQTTMLNAPLLTGSSIVLSPRFDANHSLELIAKERITLVALVPTMLHFILNGARDDAPKIDSLRCLVTGGAKLNLDTAAAFTQRFGVPVLEGYGLTETSPVVAFNQTAETNVPGSVGLPIWGCEVVVVDDKGSHLAVGVEGEVVVRGHNTFLGYLNDPEGTAELLRNGWLHTGDRGYFDADGHLYLTGLKKDMILRAGMNVYPREVELAIESHPAVAQAAVVGVPDLVRGEDVKAFVVLSGAEPITENELKAYCRDTLSSYKCPRRIEFVDELPRDAEGGIDKPVLRSRESLAAGR